MRVLILNLILQILLVASKAFASSGAGVTYHGRLVDPSGNPVTSSSVQFRLQIKTPGNENCVMYEEIQSKDMSTSNGVFALTINDGSGARQDSSGYPLDQIFANRSGYTFPASYCASGTTYTPNPSDGRSLQVYFNDGSFSGWEPVPSQAINFIPMAIESMQVGGYKKESLVKVAAGVDTTGFDLTGPNFTELMALLNGTSTQFVKPGAATFTAAPQWAGTPSTGNDLANKTYVDAQIAAGLPNFGTAGTYTKVTTDAKGRVSSGTTLAASDIPALDAAKITTGVLPIANGGTNSSAALVGSKVMVSSGTAIVEGMASNAAKSNNTFVVRDGSGNIAGALGTFDSLSVLLGGTLTLNGATSGSVALVAPTAPTTYTFTLPTTGGTNGYVLSTNGSGITSWVPLSGAAPLSSLTAASATNSIDNLNFGQTWNWSTATTQSPLTITANTLTTGSLLNLTSSSASISSSNGLLNVANTSATTTGTVARIQSNSTAGSGLTVLANGKVGVGTTSPSYTLDINGTASATSLQVSDMPTSGSRNSVYVDLELGTDSNYGNMYGIKTYLDSWGALSGRTITAMKGESIRVSHAGNSATLATGAGVDAKFDTYGSSTSVTDGFGGRFEVSQGAAGGSINNAYGLYSTVTKPTTGSIGTAYGLYLGTVAGTSKWSLYASDSTAPSYFAGNVGIGTSTPTRLLQINGPMRMTASALPGTPGTGDVAIDSGDSNKLKWYDGSTWQAAGGSAATSLSATNGSQAAPSISFSADTNTGFYSVADGSIGVTNNNSTTVYFNATSMQAMVPIQGSGASAASPAFTFAGATTTGLFSPGGNVLGFTTNGTERMRVDASGNVGIGTSTPEFLLSLAGDGGVIASGTVGAGTTLTTSGSGTRMIWYPKKSAFRAGSVNSTQWDDVNIGLYSSAMGARTQAGGQYSVAAGYGTNASGFTGIALGNTTTASGTVSTALGNSTVASGNYSTAMGIGTTASGINSSALGEYTTASGYSSAAIGASTVASGNYSTAIGSVVTADSYAQFTVGAYNQPKGGELVASWVGTDPLFVVGNGTSAASKSNALMILKNGNVGIGTTSPSAQFHVAKTGAPYLSALFESSCSGCDSYVVINNGAGPAGGSTSSLQFNVTGNGAVAGISGKALGAQDGALVFNTVNTGAFGERMRILNSGNVGIGATAPTRHLQISGNPGAGSGEGLSIVHTGAGGREYTALVTDSTNAIGGGKLTIYDPTAAAHRLVIDSSGNVGINNSAPGAQLETDVSSATTKGIIIKGAASQTANLQEWQNSGGSALSYIDAAGGFHSPWGGVVAAGGALISQDGGGYNAISISGNTRSILIAATGSSTTDLRMYRSAASTLTIDNGSGGTGNLNVNGNVGIGTTSPQATLDVNGFARLKSNASAPAACSGTNAGSIALNSTYIPCLCNGTAWYYLDSLRSGPVACVW